jgi:F-type H+-transporting ATPase subunit delta
MSEVRAALRYAKAAMELSIDQKKVKAVERDMRTIGETLAENDNLREALASPVVKISDKEAVLGAIFKDADPLSRELFSLLGSNKRIGMLGEVARQFVHLYEQMQGQDVARVVTAVPLTAELEKKILEKLKQITGKEVTVENEVDPSLIGGFILRVGDLEYNASIASKLANLKREFIHS